jgi:DNA-binding MarR family transcriptional regulator
MLSKQNSRTRGQIDSLELAHSSGHLIKVAHRLFQQSLQAELAPHGIKLSHWHCLRYLWEEDGLTQKELSKRVFIKESTTVAVLAEMEQSGLIRRVRSRDDRRKYAVCLTAKAKRITKQLLPVAKKVNEQGATGLTKKEIKLYHAITQHIITNLAGSIPEDI